MFYSIYGFFKNIKIIEHLSESINTSYNNVNLEDLSIEELDSKLLESNIKLNDLDFQLINLGIKEIVLKSINNYENLAYFGLICSLLKEKKALNGLEWLLSNSLSWQLSFQIASAACIWIQGENYAKTLNFLSRTGHFLAYQN